MSVFARGTRRHGIWGSRVHSCYEALKVCAGRTNLSPRWGFIGFPLLPTAYAVGCILTRFRGYRLTVSTASAKF
jgi:hypothetical protein